MEGLVGWCIGCQRVCGGAGRLVARTALAEAWRGQAWIATGVACGTGHIYPYTNYKPLAKFQKALPRGRPTSNSIGSASICQLSGVSRNTNARACYLGKVWPQWHNKIRHDQLVDNDVEVFVLFLFFFCFRCWRNTRHFGNVPSHLFRVTPPQPPSSRLGDTVPAIRKTSFILLGPLHSVWERFVNIEIGGWGVTAFGFSYKCLLFRQQRYPGNCN